MKGQSKNNFFQDTTDPFEGVVGEGGVVVGGDGGGDPAEAASCRRGVPVSRASFTFEATNWLRSVAKLTDQEPFFSTNPILSGAKLCFLNSSMIRLVTSFVATMIWHPFSDVLAFSIRNSRVTNFANSTFLIGS